MLMRYYVLLATVAVTLSHAEHLPAAISEDSTISRVYPTSNQPEHDTNRTSQPTHVQLPLNHHLPSSPTQKSTLPKCLKILRNHHLEKLRYVTWTKICRQRIAKRHPRSTNQHPPRKTLWICGPPKEVPACPPGWIMEYGMCYDIVPCPLENSLCTGDRGIDILCGRVNATPAAVIDDVEWLEDTFARRASSRNLSFVALGVRLENGLLKSFPGGELLSYTNWAPGAGPDPTDQRNQKRTRRESLDPRRYQDRHGLRPRHGPPGPPGLFEYSGYPDYPDDALRFPFPLIDPETTTDGRQNGRPGRCVWMDVRDWYRKTLWKGKTPWKDVNCELTSPGKSGYACKRDLVYVPYVPPSEPGQRARDWIRRLDRNRRIYGPINPSIYRPINRPKNRRKNRPRNRPRNRSRNLPRRVVSELELIRTRPTKIARVSKPELTTQSMPTKIPTPKQEFTTRSTNVPTRLVTTQEFGEPTRVIADSEPSVIQDIEPRVTHESEPRVTHESEPSVTQDSEPRVIADSEPSVIQDIEPRVTHESEPRVIADSEPRVVQDSEPRVAQDSEPRVVQNSETKVAQDSEPRVVAESEPRVVQDREPRVIADSEPRVVQDSEPRVAQDSEPKVILDRVVLQSEPIAIPNSKPRDVLKTEPRVDWDSEMSPSEIFLILFLIAIAVMIVDVVCFQFQRGFIYLVNKRRIACKMAAGSVKANDVFVYTVQEDNLSMNSSVSAATDLTNVS